MVILFQDNFVDFLKTSSYHSLLPLSQRQRSMMRIWAPEKEKVFNFMDSSSSAVAGSGHRYFCILHHHLDPYPNWNEKEKETKLLVAVLESITQRLQPSGMPRKLKYYQRNFFTCWTCSTIMNWNLQPTLNILTILMMRKNWAILRTCKKLALFSTNQCH